MTSRVVHVRLKDKTIIGCVDILETKAGISSRDHPISTMVARILDAFVKSQRAVGVIASYSEEGLKYRMEEVFGTIELKLDAVPITFDDTEEYPVSDEEPTIEHIPTQDIYEPEEDDPSLKSPVEEQLSWAEEDESPEEIVAKTVKGLSGGSIPSAFSVDEGEISEPEVPKIDVSKIEKLDFSVLKTLAPKDRLIEEAEDNENLQIAVGIVYKTISMEEWGSKKAEELVKDIYEMIG